MVRRDVVLAAAVFLVAGCSSPPSDATDETGASDSGETGSPGADTAQDRDAETEDTVPGDAMETDASETTDEIVFRITSPRSDRPVGYRLEVVERPTKVRDGSRFEAEADNDDITSAGDRWRITGETGTAASSEKVYGDSFRWPAASSPEYGIAGWSADAPPADYTITIDGNEVDPEALPALEEGSDGDCIGGGDCYGSTITAGDADATVGSSATRSDVQDALDAASSGDVVFVDPAAEINLGFFPDQPSLEVPAGVTLASNRGVGGSSGARLFGEKKPGSQWEGSDTIRVADGARIAGLRIEGPTPNEEMNWRGKEHDYTDGIDLPGSSDVEIDNNEVYGWPAAAIHGGSPVHVHHNFIHDNDQSGLGYGVSSTKWDSTIEYNDFRRNRHAVAGSGDAGDGYIVRYNTFGSEGIGGAGHKIDMHEEGNTGKAGSRMEIYRNTIEFPDAQGVYLRSTPRDSADIHDNWFYNATQPCLTKDAGGGYCAIQVRAADWSNVSYQNNHYGSDEPACDIGAPRDGC